MRRILLVSASARPGGAERALLSLAQGLPEQGWQPVPVLLEDGPLREWLGEDTTLLAAGRTRQLGRSLSTVLSLARLAREHDAAAIVSSLSKTHIYGGLAAHRAGIPAIRWQHDIPRRSRVERAAALVPAKLVICVGEASAEAQQLLTPRTPVAVVHPGVPVDEIARAAGSGASIRAARHDAGPLIGTVGRLQQGKGQEAFLHAAAAIAERLPEARFAVVGGAVLGFEGGYAERLERLAAELGIAERIHFAGHQEDVRPWLDALDITVQLSEIDSFGLVLVEAMAIGTPLIAIARGGAREIVEDGVSGLLIPDGAPGTVSDAVIRLTEHPDLVERLRAGGRERAPQFSPARSAAAFAAALEEAIR